MFEFTSSTASLMFGTSSPRIPIRLGNDSLPNQLTPVTFPPGRLRLVTRPTLTGSAPLVKTMGISAVAALAANAELLPPTAAITATCRRPVRPPARADVHHAPRSIYIRAPRYGR